MFFTTVKKFVTSKIGEEVQVAPVQDAATDASAALMWHVVNRPYGDEPVRRVWEYNYQDKKKRANLLRSLLKRRNALVPLCSLLPGADATSMSEIIAHDGVIGEMLVLICYLLGVFSIIAVCICIFDREDHFLTSTDETPTLSITSDIPMLQGDEIIVSRPPKYALLDQFENVDTERLKKLYRIRAKRIRWEQSEPQGLVDGIKAMTYEFCSNPEPDFYVKFVEDIINLMVGIHYSHINGSFDVTRLMREVVVFLKLRTDKSLTNKIFRFYFDFILEKYYEDIQETPAESMYENGFELHSFEEFLDSCEDYMGSYKDIKNSKILKQLNKFFLSIITLSIFDNIGIPFDKMGYTVLEREALKRRFTSLSILETCVETAIFVCRSGYQMYVTKSIQPIFHSSKDYQKWFEETVALQNLSKFHGDNVSYKREYGKDFNQFEFSDRLDSAIEKGENMQKFSSTLTKYEAEKLKARVCDMKGLRMDVFTTKLCRAERKAPLSFLIHGESGIAKSTLQDMIYYHCCKLMKLDPDTSNRHTLNPTTKHMDGMTRGTHTILIDDVAAKNPDKGEDATIDFLIQLINNVPFVAPMAALEDKGKVPFTGKLVIGSTNIEHLNAFKYYSHPSAIQRRFPYIITPTLKKEYLNVDTKMLDQRRVEMLEDGEYPDFWNFQIKKVKCCSVKTLYRPAIIEEVAYFTEQVDFLKWINGRVKDHEMVQDKVEHCGRVMKDIVLCTVCSLPHKMCECEDMGESSSEESEISSSGESDDSLSADNEDDIDPEINYKCIFCHLLKNECQCTVEFTEDIIKKVMPDGSYLTYPLRRQFAPEAEIQGVISWSINTWMQCKEFTRYYFNVAIIKTILFISPLPFLGPIFNRLYLIYTLRRFNRTGQYHNFDDIHYWRIFFNSLGERVSSKWFGPGIFLASFLTSFLAVRGIIAIAKKLSKFASQGAEQSTCRTTTFEDHGVTPEPEENGRENVWYNNSYQLTSYDVGKVVNSTKGLTRDEFIGIISGNLIDYVLEDKTPMGRRERRGKALCVYGQYYLFNAHIFQPMEGSMLHVLNAPDTPGCDANKSFVVTKEQIEAVYEDLILVKLPNMLHKRNILMFFPDNEIRCRSNGFYVARDRKGCIEVIDVAKSCFMENISIQDLAPMNSWQCIAKTRNTIKGDCGSVLVMETPQGFVISGFHYAGLGCTAMSIAMNKKIIPDHNDVCAIQGGNMEFLESETAPKAIGDLHPKSPLRYLEEGECDVIGSLKGFQAKPRSTVCDTPIHNELKKYGYEKKYTKPMMQGWLPKRTAILDMVKPNNKLKYDVLVKAKESYFKHIRENLPKSELDKLTPYSLFTAVNGAAGVAYVDKINRGTSSGYPWNTSKKSFLESIPEEHGLPNPVKVKPEIEKRIKAMMEKMAEGKRCYPVFKAHLKDEPVTFAKAKIGKTRVFTGAPMDFSIVVRKFYLSFIRVLQSNRFLFEAGPGTIAQSKEWQEIYEYLTTFGKKRIVAGDYKSFDKKMMAFIMMLGFEGIVELCELSNNFTEEDLTIMKAIAADTSFPFIDFFGDLIQFHGSNPSGHPLTVIINSICNSIYMRYCYYELNPNKECDSFAEYVKLMTYGDDNIMGVSKETPWFNHTAIANCLAEVDIVYTMAEKTAKSVPYIDIRDASFLKRTWRFDKDVGAYVCPLDHDSIEKMLMTWTKSKNICEQEQLIAVVTSANMEYFWYGKETYYAKQRMLKSVLETVDVSEWIEDSTFPTWDTLKDRFWSYSNSGKSGDQ